MKRMHEIKYSGDSVTSIDGKSVGGGSGYNEISFEINSAMWDDDNTEFLITPNDDIYQDIVDNLFGVGNLNQPVLVHIFNTDESHQLANLVNVNLLTSSGDTADGFYMRGCFLNGCEVKISWSEDGEEIYINSVEI